METNHPESLIRTEMVRSSMAKREILLAEGIQTAIEYMNRGSYGDAEGILMKTLKDAYGV